MSSPNINRVVPIAWSNVASVTAVFSGNHVFTINAFPSLSYDESGGDEAAAAAALVIRHYKEERSAATIESLLNFALESLPPIVGTEQQPRDGVVRPSLEQTSRSYRAIVDNNISEWDDAIAGFVEDGSISAHEAASDVEIVNLKIISAVHNLAEIVFLSSFPSKTGLSLASFSGSGKGGSGDSAKMVRFLRNHIVPFPSLEDTLGIVDDTIESMTNSQEPESWRNDSGTTVGGQRCSPFWTMVRAYCISGRLHDAWTLLSYHSLCNSPNATEDDNQGFYDLRGILLFAPIPGGRSIEEEDAPLPAASENIGDMDKDLFLGIPFAAWRMWDGHGGGASSAMSHWRTWCSYLENSSKMGSDTFLGKLIRKVPMLRWAVIDVLKGKVQWTEHVSWAEALLVELLYGDPRTLQSSLVEKARTAMHIAGGKSEVNEVHMKFLKILEGNAAEAVNTIHSLGGSGDSPIAATVCALLCDLLTRSGKIDFKISEGDNYCYIRSDFFHSAAMSCEAAFVGYNGHAGVLTAAKLLKLDESRNAIAAIHDLFCRHYPQKDEETKELMQFCKYDPDLQDAGCTLACARANSYLSESKQGDFVYWMLRGIEAIDSSSSLTKFNAITCLSSHCGNIAQNILYNLASKGFKEITTELEDGKMVVKAIEKDAVLNNPDMGSVSRAFSLLSNVVDLGVSIQSENYINSCDIIISCLLSRTEYNGVNLPLAPVMLYCPLIKIAAVLISQIKSSFDVSGIQTLMSSLSIIEQNLCLVDETLQKIGILRSNWNRSLNGASLTFTIEGLRREFGKGLALAYLKKNKLCNLDERILIDGLDDSAHYVNEVLYCSFI